MKKCEVSVFEESALVEAHDSRLHLGRNPAAKINTGGIQNDLALHPIEPDTVRQCVLSCYERARHAPVTNPAANGEQIVGAAPHDLQKAVRDSRPVLQENCL
jgi:hypothetical protein